MSNKPLNPSATALLAQLTNADADGRAELAKQFELTCDFTEANRIRAERTELETELAKLQTRISEYREAEEAALHPCVADFVPKLEPAWFTPEFLDRFGVGDFKIRLTRTYPPITMEEYFTRVNQGIGLTNEQGYSLAYLAYNGRATYQDRQRAANFLWVRTDGHICGRSYQFTKAQAKRLCEWALPYWRGEPGASKKVPRTIRHDGETHTVEISDTCITIGCQTLAKGEVVRIASLFGWAGQPKMIGPEYRKEEPKPKKATTTRSRSKKAEPVAA